MSETPRGIVAPVRPSPYNHLVRAADISGRSLSDFVVHAAHQAALQEIEHQVILQLSGRDSDTLAAALETEPAEPTAAFKRAVALRDRILRGTKPEKE